MKKIFLQSAIIVLVCIYSTALQAQQTDSLIKSKPAANVIPQNPVVYYIVDTFHALRGMPLEHKIVAISNAGDSLLRKTKRLVDSSRKAFIIKKYTADSMHRRLFIAKADTLLKLRKEQTLKIYDSLKHIYIVTNDSMIRKHKLALSIKLADSVKRKIYIEKIKADSVKLKRILQVRKMQLYKTQYDSVRIVTGYGMRKLLMEITCFNGDTVFINNNSKKIIVKTIPAQKVRLTTNISYQQPLNDRDDVLFKKMGITVSRVNTSVTAIADCSDKNGIKKDDVLNTAANMQQPLIIEVPGNAVIIINSKYTDAAVESYVKDINVHVSYGNLTMTNAGTASIKAKNALVNAANLDNAILDLSASRFKASNVVSMNITSSNSQLQITSSAKIELNSTSDVFTIDKAGSISGNQKFGRLRVENLNDKMILSGNGANIAVTSFNNTSPFIKIDSRFADVKLPLSQQENFAVYYEGSYKDVNNASTLTSKLTGAGKMNATFSVQRDTIANNKQPLTINKTVLKAMSGNLADKHTKIDIVCPDCNVVFN